MFRCRLDLVRVDLGQQPVLSAGKQNAAGFLGGKNALFAEHIAEFRNALLPDCRKQNVKDQASADKAIQRQAEVDAANKAAANNNQ